MADVWLDVVSHMVVVLLEALVERLADVLKVGVNCLLRHAEHAELVEDGRLALAAMRTKPTCAMPKDGAVGLS